MFDFIDDDLKSYEEIREESGTTPPNHIVGLVCVDDFHKSEFDFRWPEFMLPLNTKFTLLERSVMECLWAGCESIWVVCKDKSIPFVEDVLPDYAVDPYSLWASLNRKNWHGDYSFTKVPIYTIRARPADMYRREYISWHILAAAKRIYDMFSSSSKWLRPDKYYVSFPWGVTNPYNARNARLYMTLNDGVHCYTYGGEDIKDDRLLGFSFEMDDYVKCKETIWEIGAGNWKYLYKNPELMSVGNIFGEVKEFDHRLEPDWFYEIMDWQDYLDVLADDPTGLDNPPDNMYKRGRDWDPLGEWKEI